jgi:hypothetical protein
MFREHFASLIQIYMYLQLLQPQKRWEDFSNYYASLVALLIHKQTLSSQFTYLFIFDHTQYLKDINIV